MQAQAEKSHSRDGAAQSELGNAKDSDPSPYVGFDPLDWSVDMQELPAATYLLQDRYLVYIPKFRIARFQVTRQLYNSVMHRSRPRDKNKPVGRVSWIDAVRFSNELSKLAGLQPAYRIRELRYPVKQDGEQKTALRYEVAWLTENNGYRLPTEAEWEYAARGARAPDGETPSRQNSDWRTSQERNERTRTGGFLYSGSNIIDNVAWYDGNSQGLQPVGQKEPNEIGLYDMSGNAWDWLWDRYIDLQQSPLAQRERLEPGTTAPWRVLKPEVLTNAYRSEGRSLGQQPDEPSVRQYVHKYLVWRGPSSYESRASQRLARQNAAQEQFRQELLRQESLRQNAPKEESRQESLRRGRRGLTASTEQVESFQDLRVCRGGAWNFAKVHSEIMQRSPCIAEADYYSSVSFRLAQNAE